VWVDGHHIAYWAEGGETRLSNLCLLCRAHHRAVHEYGYRVVVNGTDLAFFRPDGSKIELPEPPQSSPTKVIEANRTFGFRIDPETPLPDWYGETMDYDVAVGWLMGTHGFNEDGAG
jgi:hypothetical protein